MGYILINYMRKVYSILILVFFVCSTVNAQKNKFKRPKFKLLNKTFPISELIDINGDNYELFKEKNTIYVFNFWFSRCKPCVAEIPTLNKLKKDFSEYKIKFIAVTFDDLINTKKILKKKPFNFEQYHLDGKKITDSKLCSQGYPTNLIVDENKIIRFQKAGSYTDPKIMHLIYDTLSDEIKKLNPKKKL